MKQNLIKESASIGYLCFKELDVLDESNIFTENNVHFEFS